jgi:outer membrane lipoprotein-sorting protein
MKKILISALFIIGSFFHLHAQDVAKAKEILGKVSAKYKKFNTIKADFKYTLEITGDKKFKETQAGTLYLKKTKFKLESADQVVISDGVTLWTYIKDAKEVQINNYSSKIMDINPTEIFTIYEKGYLCGYTGEEADKKKTMQVIELTPEDKKQSFFKVKMYINKANSEIARAKIYEKNGNIYTYEINSMVPNSKMEDSFFNWEDKAYPGVKKVDLRPKKKK